MRLKFNRGQRRHDNAVIKASFKKKNSFSAICTYSERDLGFFLNTACVCSCRMCGNPRKYYGNAKQSLTRQEVKADAFFACPD